MLLCIILTFYSLGDAARLIIAHTNDVHARISQAEVTGGYSGCRDPSAPFNASLHSKYFTGCHGGAARRKTKIDELRSENDNVLLLDAGDEFQGTLWYNIYRGWATAYVVNAMKYDAISFGNHEFDNGETVLEGYLDLLDDSIQVLAANVETKDNSLLKGKFNSSAIFTLTTGERVGVVGYVVASTPKLSNPGPNLKFDAVLASVQAEVDKLRAAGVDLVIGVGHVGWAEDHEIAMHVRGMDVVIGGHTDTFCYTGDPLEQSQYAFPSTSTCDYPQQVTGADGQTVCVAQAFTYGTWLGKMDVEFDSNGVTSCGGNPIFLSGETVEQDPVVLDWTMTYWQQIEDSYSDIIGQTRIGASGQKVDMRTGGDAALGNLYTDAMVQLSAAYVDDSFPTPMVAVWNGGGLRADLPEGDVSVGDVMSITPFGNDVVTLKAVPGSVIVDVIEHGVSEVENAEGRFGHWSGVRFQYDPELPPSYRVVKAEILCFDCGSEIGFVDLFQYPNKQWDVLTSAYQATGGDGFDMLPNYYDGVGGSFVDYDIFVQYIEDYGPVVPRQDGRIQVVNSTILANPCSDLSPHCKGLQNQCKDGTVSVGGTNIQCFETCNYCPHVVSPNAPKNDDNCDSGGIKLAFILTTVALCTIIMVLAFAYFKEKALRKDFEKRHGKDPQSAGSWGIF